jgi:putative transposase
LQQILDAWAYEHGVKLDFVSPGKPVANGFIKSFNRRLRVECLNTHLFWRIKAARKKLKMAHGLQPCAAA